MPRKISEYFTPVSNKQQQLESNFKYCVKEKVKKGNENFKDYSNFESRECSVVIEDFSRKVIKKVIENPKSEKTPKISRADMDGDDVESDISFKVSNEDVKLDPKMKNTDNSESKFNTCENQNGAKLKSLEVQAPKYKCKYCTEVMHNQKSFSKHLKEMHSGNIDDKVFRCMICDTIFTNPSGLNKHIARIHAETKSIHYECDFDGKVFKDRRKIFNHMKTHRSKVKCTICDGEFNAESLSNHMKNMHAERQHFVCKICSKSFKSNEYLKAHFKVHSKRFECQTCLKKFKTNYHLKIHIKLVHENPKSFICEICKRGFNRNEILKNHLKTHDKYRLKPLKCHRCDYATDSSKDIKMHLSSHQRQDEKFAAMKNPLKCEKCPTLCRNKVSLRNHVYQVHPAEKYQCDLCGNYMKIKVTIKYHIQRVHLKITKNRM